MGLVKVSPMNWPVLIQRLNQESLICKRPMIGCLQHALKGLLSANFYVDTWPDWNTLIGQILAPKISEKFDLVCYGRSTEEVWQLIQELDILCDEKSHCFIGNDAHLESVPKVLKLSYSLDFYTHFYFPNSARPKLESVRVPDGYFLQRLERKHASIVSKHWPYFSELPNRTSVIADFIGHFTSVGAFCIHNSSQPVSWMCLFHCGEMAFVYTVKEYRMKGLSKAVIAAATQALLDSSITPYLVTKAGSEIVKRMYEKLGYAKDTVDDQTC